MGGKSNYGRTLHHKIKLFTIFKFLFCMHLVIILQHSHPLSQFSADWIDVALCVVSLIQKSTLFGWRRDKCLQVTQKHNSKTLQSLTCRSLGMVLLCACTFASHITAGKNQPLCCHASHSLISCTMYYHGGLASVLLYYMYLVIVT